MKLLIRKSHRFSISWSMILPAGRGAVNERGIDHYKLIMDVLLETGTSRISGARFGGGCLRIQEPHQSLRFTSELCHPDHRQQRRCSAPGSASERSLIHFSRAHPRKTSPSAIPV